MGVDNPEIIRIGIRHGEKMYETLLSREEMAKATNQDDYFKVPLDARSLQYSLYVDEGDSEVKRAEDFDSNSTAQMSIDQTADLIASLPEMQSVLAELNG